MKSIIVVLVLLFFLVSCFRQEPAEVSIYEKPLSIPTYQIGEPERNPMFYVPVEYQGAQFRIYPYPLLDKLTDNRIEKNYQGLFLENKYVQICVLPELGGRLYFAKDKTNGYDFIYHNHVIKPALIGMAGAWISGGVEWNIPHHHRVSTFMPVDYKLAENSDGSKTIWIGEYEKRHGSKWMVGLTLHPDRSYIQTDIRLLNVTPEEQSFLIWANMAVHANENYQVIFPPDVEQAVFHSKVEFTSWPLSKQFYLGIDFTSGVDVSWWKNAPSPTSYFAWGSDMDFIGGIDHGKNAGTVLVGEHHTVPGKKFWNWGKNEVARLWDRQMLTDSDGSYLELMMGAFSDNQPDYSWNDPYHSKNATMFYSPVRNLSSIKNANKDFAVNVECADGKAQIQIYATAEFDDLKYVLSDSGGFRHERVFSITPADPYAAEVNIFPAVQNETVRFTIVDKDGIELFHYQGKPGKDMPFPDTYKPPHEPASYRTVDELYLAGLRLEQFHNPDYDPLAYYFEAVKREPDNILVNTQLGMHYLRHQDYEKAERHLRIAVKAVTANHTSPKDCEPLYYFGLCLFEQERFAEAYDMLYKSSWSHAWASASYYLISCIDCRGGDLAKALAHADRSMRENANNIDAFNLKCMILRHRQRYAESLATARSALDSDPLDFIAMNELYLLSGHLKEAGNVANLAEALSSAMRAEPDNFLESAARYARAGFYQDAIRLLTMAVQSGDEKLQSYPLVYYYLGFYQGKISDAAASRQNLQKGALLPVDYCFPYGRESARVLTAAVHETDNDANAWYYLGNLYYDHRPELAAAYWQKAISLNNQTAVFHRNMAFAQANYLNDLPKAVDLMRTAIGLAPTDPLYLSELDLYLAALNTPPAERIKLFLAHPDAVQKSDETMSRLIVLTSMLGEYEDAIAKLKQRHFHSAERFDVNLHSTWVDAHILRGSGFMRDKRYNDALADFEAVLEFPRNLEIARDAKSELAFYFIGQCYKQLGEYARAEEFFKKSLQKRGTGGWAGGEWPEVIYSKALACRELGRHAEAGRLLKEMISAGNAQLSSRPHAARYTNSVRRRYGLQRSKARACVRIALGYLGQENKKQADDYLRKAQELDVSITQTLIFR